MLFYHIGAAKCYEKKSKNSNKYIKFQEFCGKVVLLHGFFTSNLYPIPHTVAIDQWGLSLIFSLRRLI